MGNTCDASSCVDRSAEMAIGANHRETFSAFGPQAASAREVDDPFCGAQSTATAKPSFHRSAIQGFPHEVDEAATLDQVINVMLYFEQAPDLRTLVELFRRHIYPLDHFSCRVSSGCWLPVDVMRLDEGYHFTEELHEDEGAADLRAEELVMEPFDHKHPLWRVHVLRTKLGRSAVMLRIHHCISDGLGLLVAFSPIFEVEGGGSALDTVTLPRSARVASQRGAGDFAFSSMTSSTSSWNSSMSSSSSPGTGDGGGLLSSWQAFIGTCWGVCMPVCVGPDVQLGYNTPLAKKQKLGKPAKARRRYMRLPPAEVDVMKKIGKAFGASLNTVALAALAGAWRSYGIQVHRDPNLPENQKTTIAFKALVPVALPRPLEEYNPASSLVNRWVYSSVPLPLGTPQPSLRIREVRTNCEHLKSPGLGGLQLAGQSLLPAGTQEKMQGDLMKKHSMTVTNVPGPQVPMRIAGQMVQEIQIVMPSTISQVGFISYAGFLCANLVVDPEIVPHAEVLAASWSTELLELHRLSQTASNKRKRNAC